MSPNVATEDLIDAHGVAEILGLVDRKAVSVYQHRYADMPRPIIDLARGRTKLWLRPQIEQWAVEQVARGRTRPARRAASRGRRSTS